MKEISSDCYNKVAGGFGGTCGPNDCGSSSSGANSGSSASGGGSKQERDYKTSNRGSGSQANNFGSSASSGFGDGGYGGRSNKRDLGGKNH